MDLNKLTALPLTYPEVGATRGVLPAGYHHTDATATTGDGRQCFDEAADAVMRYGMQHSAGLRVQASTEVAAVDTVLLVRLGMLRAPCRVVYVVDEPNRRGFAYGTLPGHPESGEELFAVRYDPDSDAVYAEVRAFSRPATWWSKLGSPVTAVAQRIITRRYLRPL